MYPHNEQNDKRKEYAAVMPVARKIRIIIINLVGLVKESSRMRSFE